MRSVMYSGGMSRGIIAGLLPCDTKSLAEVVPTETEGTARVTE
jgi:hypothetical protein